MECLGYEPSASGIGIQSGTMRTPLIYMEKSKKPPKKPKGSPKKNVGAKEDNPKHKRDFEGLLDLAGRGLGVDNPKER